MYYSLKGKIEFIDKNYIGLNVHDVTYLLYMSHPNDFIIGEERLIYTSLIVREDEQYLIGFATLNEKKVFESLIKVKGLGPKSAIQALSATTPDEILKAISSNNVTYLKKLPGIGPKAASQIILDLKGELTGEKGDPHRYEEVRDALKQLGFKVAQIDNVLTQINEPNASMEEILNIALKMLRKK